MTLTLPALRRTLGEPATEVRETRTDQLQSLCAALAFVGLGYALMHSGGRDPAATDIALVLTAPLLLAGRVWRSVPLLELVLAACVAAVSVVVPLVTPLGVSAAGDLNAYTYAAVLYLAVRAFAQEREHRRLIAIAVLCLGVVEFLHVIRVWMGENDPSFQVVGTFYWHNQFGAFAAAIALVACGMVMRSERMEDAIAWLVAPLFLALAYLSHSRAALLALVLTGIFLPGVALARRQWRPLLRLACAGVLAVAVYGLMIAAVSSGHGFSPGKDSLSSSSEFRVAAAEEGIKVFDRAPLLSHGYGSLSATGWQHPPAGTTTSPYAHSAEIQALSDGGLILGVPVILAMALLGWRALRSGARAARRRTPSAWLPLGASLAALALLLHASMDFDSQYPVLLGLFALLVAFVAPAAKDARPSHLVWRRLAFGVTVAATVLGGLLVASYWQTTHRLDAAASQIAAEPARAATTATLALADHHFYDPRPATFIVEASDLGIAFDQTTLQHALRESQAYARLDHKFAPVWHRVSSREIAASRASGPTTTRH